MRSVPRVYVITDRRLAPEGDLPTLLAEALRDVEPGTVAVQLREKDLTAAELVALARAVLAVTRPAGVPLLVNDRLDVALAVDADGVHLAGHSLGPGDARRLLGPDRLLAASTHSVHEARAAAEGGCDFAVFGPVFHTPSKARYGEPVGLDRLADACQAVAPFPLVALGGVNGDNGRPCLGAGAAGLSVIRAVLAAPDPNAALLGLLECKEPT